MYSQTMLKLQIVLLSLISQASCYVNRECKGCPSPSTLKSPAYGIDLSVDYLTIAVQHVNGTLLPIAHLNASTSYRETMLSILSTTSITPYGHRSLSAKVTASPSSSLDSSQVAVFTTELRSLIASIYPPLSSPIQHYFLSVPMFFTPASEALIHSALTSLSLPAPISTVTSESAAFLSLKRGNCDHFVQCAPVDFEKHILLFIDYSRSALSASFLNFWGGWFLTPHAYFVDVELGAEHEEEKGEEHWEVISHRIQALIEDYEHKLFEGPEDKRRFSLDTLRISILGERGADPRFRKAVEDALEIFDGSDAKKELRKYEEEKVLEPVYFPALGIAREAKDRIDKRGIMAGCNSEPAACTKVREIVIEDAMIGKPKGKKWSGYASWRDEL